MKVADVLRFFLDIDQQQLTSRPSAAAMMAEIVADLAEHAEGSLRDGSLDGWRDVDLSPFYRGSRRKLNQPTDDLLCDYDRLRKELAIEKRRANYYRCLWVDEMIRLNRANGDGSYENAEALAEDTDKSHRAAWDEMIQGEANTEEPRTTSVETFAALRAAGGDAWDKVEDVDAYLGRTGQEGGDGGV